jgi:hypothetical protein
VNNGTSNHPRDNRRSDCGTVCRSEKGGEGFNRRRQEKVECEAR